jgi:hypothetical protein
MAFLEFWLGLAADGRHIWTPEPGRAASVGRPPSISRAGAGAYMTLSSPQAYLVSFGIQNAG